MPLVHRLRLHREDVALRLYVWRSPPVFQHWRSCHRCPPVHLLYGVCARAMHKSAQTRSATARPRVHLPSIDCRFTSASASTDGIWLTPRSSLVARMRWPPILPVRAMSGSAPRCCRHSYSNGHTRIDVTRRSNSPVPAAAFTTCLNLRYPRWPAVWSIPYIFSSPTFLPLSTPSSLLAFRRSGAALWLCIELSFRPVQATRPLGIYCFFYVLPDLHVPRYACIPALLFLHRVII
jgi:hypothetical protein